MTPKPTPPSEGAVADELAACLAALGARTGPPLGERILAWLRGEWKGRSLENPPQVRDCATALDVSRNAVQHELVRLEAAGAVLHPRKGVWVPARVG